MFECFNGRAGQGISNSGEPGWDPGNSWSWHRAKPSTTFSQVLSKSRKTLEIELLKYEMIISYQKEFMNKNWSCCFVINRGQYWFRHKCWLKYFLNAVPSLVMLRWTLVYYFVAKMVNFPELYFNFQNKFGNFSWIAVL